MNQLTPLSMRDKVSAIEAEMFNHPQVALEVRHYFSQGVYARELSIPAGILLTGKIHKYQQINILSKGVMRVLTDNGVIEAEAPFTVVSPPGTKRIALAVTDCVWTTFLPTNETNTALIESQFTVDNEEEYQAFLTSENEKCLS